MNARIDFSREYELSEVYPIIETFFIRITNGDISKIIWGGVREGSIMHHRGKFLFRACFPEWLNDFSDRM